MRVYKYIVNNGWRNARADTNAWKTWRSFVVSFRTTFGRKSGRGFTGYCVTVKIGSRVATPRRGEGGDRRETTILCRRCPCTKHRDESSINNPDRHARSRPPNERNSRGIPRGYVAQFGENSVDRNCFSPSEEVFETMGTKIQWRLSRKESLVVRDLGQISGYFLLFLQD